MMQLADETDAAQLQNPDFERLLQDRLHQAVQLRRMLGLPSAHTTVFRLCNRYALAAAATASAAAQGTHFPPPGQTRWAAPCSSRGAGMPPRLNLNGILLHINLPLKSIST